MRNFLLVLVVALSITGCASMQQTGAALTTAPQSAKIVVQYATMKYIEKAGTYPAQQSRAMRVIDVASRAQIFVEAGTASTVPLLEQAVRDGIDWSRFTPADRLLVDNIITLVRQELEARIGATDAPIDDRQRIVIRELLGWVIAAANIAAA